MGGMNFDRCLEIGCGTGKNSEWLAMKAQELLAVDFSDEMLARAKAKVKSGNVRFEKADITGPWDFTKGSFDVITFSLVLEHLQHLDPIFEKAARVSHEGTLLYVGELHPFKQYTGSKARFKTGQGLSVVECYDHHISDFINAAQKGGFSLVKLQEYFDDDRPEIPRILSLLFKKS
ncbi:MAG: class I SAM-dependent methyltransferase [Owenweeksia sp.]